MQTARKIKPEVAPKKRPKKQLRVVKTKRQRRMPDSSSLFSFFLMSAIILAAILIFNVSQRALIAQGALQNKQLEDTFEQEQLKQQKLLLAKTRMSAPERIEKVAVEKLGMVNPAEVSYLELPNEMGKQKEVAKPLNSLTSKKNSPWQIMTERVGGQLSVSLLRGPSLHRN